MQSLHIFVFCYFLCKVYISLYTVIFSAKITYLCVLLFSEQSLHIFVFSLSQCKVYISLCSVIFSQSLHIFVFYYFLCKVYISLCSVIFSTKFTYLCIYQVHKQHFYGLSIYVNFVTLHVHISILIQFRTLSVIGESYKRSITQQCGGFTRR